jgi:hypothetical protein
MELLLKIKNPEGGPPRDGDQGIAKKIHKERIEHLLRGRVGIPGRSEEFSQ